MTTSFGSRRRKSVQEEAQSQKKTRRRANKRLIKEGEFMPVIIKGYSAGIPTSNDKKMTSYEFEHIESRETFSATVFEDEAPDYINDKILDAVLPEDLDEFDSEDLVGRGLYVKVKFNTKNDRTFTNIVDAEPLDEEDQARVDEMAVAEEQKMKRLAKDIQKSVDMIAEMDAQDRFSKRPATVSMEEMEAPDPYTQGIVRKDSDKESTPCNISPDRRRQYKRATQVTEDEEGLNLDEDNIDSDEAFEVYICDECQDKGCEACDLDLSEDDEEDFGN